MFGQPGYGMPPIGGPRPMMPNQTPPVLSQQIMSNVPMRQNPQTGCFLPQNDCKLLNDAMKGTGSNKDQIIHLLTNRTNAQRLQIKATFEEMFKKDLIKELKSELKGKFEDAVVALFDTPIELDCKALYKAMKGLGTDEETLIEIICTRPNWRLNQDKELFPKLYKKDLSAYVKGDTSGTFEKLLLACLEAKRNENPYVDDNLCRTAAQELYKAGEGKWGTDSKTFVDIIATKSALELKSIDNHYKAITNHSIFDAIDKEFSGNTKKYLKLALNAIMNPAEYFAERIRDSMKGFGTKDTMLIRLLISRDEIDMPQIKAAYQRMYGKDIITDIRSETKGDYETLLVELVNH